MLKHIGKEKVKVSFEVTIVRAFNLEKSLNGSTVYIQWRRGSKSASGMTTRALVSKNEAYWNEPVTFTSTFYKNSHEKFDKKELTFSLKEVRINNISICALKEI